MGETTKIVLAGEGGQGVQSVAGIIAEAANEEGRQALYIPNFGVEQRGGVSVAYVQISDSIIGSPKFQTGDIVVALSGRAVRRSSRYVGSNTTFIYDSGIEGVEGELPRNAGMILPIPAIETAKKDFHPRVFNIIIMGAVVGATGVIPLESAKEAVEKKLGYKFEKQPKLRELNFKAMERGVELVAEAAKYQPV
ncbi:MAG: NADH-dependent phenylglyoxylate dehydrogenase subunit gamma [Pelotomaculum sp. PtaU1.Bin035]|nr:MAG: NADH-dependent phenylglyoxylate dehydrogenase subunit gamma [Pelotomaculum sp. PtaU1.Bin035]